MPTHSSCSPPGTLVELLFSVSILEKNSLSLKNYSEHWTKSTKDRCSGSDIFIWRWFITSSSSPFVTRVVKFVGLGDWTRIPGYSCILFFFASFISFKASMIKTVGYCLCSSHAAFVRCRAVITTIIKNYSRFSIASNFLLLVIFQWFILKF